MFAPFGATVAYSCLPVRIGPNGRNGHDARKSYPKTHVGLAIRVCSPLGTACARSRAFERHARPGDQGLREWSSAMPNGRRKGQPHGTYVYARLAEPCEPLTLPCRNSPIVGRTKYQSKGRQLTRVAGKLVTRIGNVLRCRVGCGVGLGTAHAACRQGE